MHHRFKINVFSYQFQVSDIIGANRQKQNAVCIMVGAVYFLQDGIHFSMGFTADIAKEYRFLYAHIAFPFQEIGNLPAHFMVFNIVHD